MRAGFGSRIVNAQQESVPHPGVELDASGMGSQRTPPRAGHSNNPRVTPSRSSGSSLTRARRRSTSASPRPGRPAMPLIAPTWVNGP